MQKLLGVCWIGTLVFACGGSQPPAESAESESAAEAPATAPPPAASEEPKAEEEKPPEKKPEAAPEPEFKDGMSVADAMNAVPQGADRRNIEQEALAKPLQDPKTFEACKVGSAHYKVKIAVWDGKAVGIDLTTTPKNQKLADCLTSKIKEISWPDKVKSLNTVEFQF